MNEKIFKMKLGRVALVISLVLLAVLSGYTQTPAEQISKEIEYKSIEGLYDPERDPTKDYIVYMPNGWGSLVTILDTSDMKIAGRITSPPNPHGLDIVPRGKFAGRYAVTSNMGICSGLKDAPELAHYLSVIDTIINKEVARVPTKTISHHVMFSPDGKYGYAAIGAMGPFGSENYSGLLVFEAKPPFKVVKRVPFDDKTGNFYTYPSADGKYVYNSLIATNKVAVVEVGTWKVVKYIEVGKGPDHIIDDPAGKLIYVSVKTRNAVAVIDPKTNEVVKYLPNIDKPHSLTISWDGRYMYSSSWPGGGGGGSQWIMVYDLKEDKIMPPILGSGSSGTDSIGKYVYLGEYAAEDSFLVVEPAKDPSKVQEIHSWGVQWHDAAGMPKEQYKGSDENWGEERTMTEERKYAQWGKCPSGYLDWYENTATLPKDQWTGTSLADQDTVYKKGGL